MAQDVVIHVSQTIKNNEQVETANTTRTENKLKKVAGYLKHKFSFQGKLGNGKRMFRAEYTSNNVRVGAPG